MLSCKEVTHLVSESLDRKLSISERFRMQLHFRICAYCRNFRRQMTFLRQACRRLAEGKAPFDSDQG
ncbi:MAG: zf-HC2 domain-containing protein [Betaproteobacteria bacterium]|nr:zf-HC2 domain-containing protein [Betaproteobacteria bacterium]